MATGIQHATATFLLTPVAAGAAYGLSHGDTTVAALAGVGCLSGILLTPDLDVDIVTTSQRWAIRWTFGLGWLWVGMWYPYARLIKHRNFVSHSPLFSTVVRMLYLGIWYTFAYALLRNFFDSEMWLWPVIFWHYTLVFTAGLVVSDVAHWVMDR
jgi:uncharacterized metal-binding protein